MAFPAAAIALTETEPLSMVYEAPAAPRALSNCRMHVRGVEDLRRNRETLGAAVHVNPAQGGVPLAGASLLSGDGLKWTRGAVQSLGTAGIQISDGLPPAGELAIDVGLRLAHAWMSGLNMHSHVVLQAAIALPGGEQLHKRYHGFATKLNWNNGNSEYMTTLNMAMSDALQAYAADLHNACSGKPVAP
jgi:hypothetical protein